MLALLPLLAALSAPPSPPGWQTNFVLSPSAEEDANRDGQPDGWHADAYQSPAQLAWDSQVAHSGRHSLRISDSFNAGKQQWNETTGRWVLVTRKPVTAGTTYTLEAWIKTQGVTGGANARIAWFAKSKWLAESTTQSVRGDQDWQRVVITAKAPEEAAEASVYLGLGQSKGTAWFDDVSMVAGESLPSNLRPVDLGSAARQPLVIPPDALRAVAGGRSSNEGPLAVSLRGVPFVLQTSGGHVQAASVGADQDKSIEISLGAKCQTLYFLHAASGLRSRIAVGQYELLYADGTSQRLPLTAGREVGDFAGPRETTQSAVAWTWNDGSEQRGLSFFPISNPRPADAIQKIRLRFTANAGRLCLAALTLADGPAVLTEPPIAYQFTDMAGWYPFTFALDDTNRDSIDLTSLLDGPAGKHGFLTTRPDGHFYFADGTRARFFGTNICGRAAAPEREAAVQIAARLAKYGVNLLRIHSIDGRWGPLVDAARNDSRHFDPAALDRLDFFFAELKRRGIYVYFDCLDYRYFKDGDGVRDASEFEHGWRHSIKGASCYNPRMIELQKEFATEFYTHLNPYTKLRYVDDPAVAVVEITNENSVFYFQNTELTLPSYRRELEERWNQWLTQRFGSREALARAWTDSQGRSALAPEEDPARGSVGLPLAWLYQDPASPGGKELTGPRSPLRVNAMVRFFFELERAYYRQMYDHLRSLGLRVPITGTNQTFCPASNYADAANDFMSRNNYWQHPNVNAKPRFTFRNLAVLESELAKIDNPITEVTSSSVAGKPIIVPEFNFPWPNEYRVEGLLLMTAYACLQDWDGLLLFDYEPGRPALTWFGSQSDPVRWGIYPAAALIFHRQDVSAAQHSIAVAYSEDEIFTAGPSHSRRAESPYRDYGYRSKVRNVYADAAAPAGSTTVRGAAYRSPQPAPADRYASDTGQLKLDPQQALFTLDTPRAKAACGDLNRSGVLDLSGVTIESTTPFAAVIVTALDPRPIGSAGRLLVTAVARAENTGQAFANNHRSVPEVGRLPVLAEPVRGRLRVPVGGKAEAYSLDETGKRRQSVPLVQKQGLIELSLDELRSPWAEIVISQK